MMHRALLWAAGVALSAAAVSPASLIISHTDTDGAGAVVDGVIDTDEYGPGNTYNYTGGGWHFGSQLGSATLHLQSDATHLYLGFYVLGVPVDGNQVLVYFDTGDGGFSTDTGAANAMGDLSDAGRANVSRLARDGIETIPFDADCALALNNRDPGSGGFTAFFDLEGVGTNHTYFAESARAGLGYTVLELSVPLSSLGISAGETIKFAAYLISDTGYLSDEGLPSPLLADNPGFNTGGNIGFSDWHEFTVAIPEPGTMLFMGSGLLLLALQALRRLG